MVYASEHGAVHAACTRLSSTSDPAASEHSFESQPLDFILTDWHPHRGRDSCSTQAKLHPYAPVTERILWSVRPARGLLTGCPQARTYHSTQAHRHVREYMQPAQTPEPQRQYRTGSEGRDVNNQLSLPHSSTPQQPRNAGERAVELRVA